MHNLSLPESTLLQAVTNTQVSREGGAGLAGREPVVRDSAQEPPPPLAPLPQVIDGFFVKRTADIKESAAYLALLTRGLQRLYQVSRPQRVPSVTAGPSLGCCTPSRKASRPSSLVSGWPTEAWVGARPGCWCPQSLGLASVPFSLRVTPSAVAPGAPLGTLNQRPGPPQTLSACSSPSATSTRDP